LEEALKKNVATCNFKINFGVLDNETKTYLKTFFASHSICSAYMHHIFLTSSMKYRSLCFISTYTTAYKPETQG
jgi:hypothetical protein